MRPVLNKQESNTILVEDITYQHLIVGVISNHPCILSKGFGDGGKRLNFGMLDGANTEEGTFTYGNGFDFSSDEDTPTKMVKRAIMNGGEVEVFHPKDWKKALQWLIDNA